MLSVQDKILSKYKFIFAIIFASLLSPANAAKADALDAGFVLNQMEVENRYPFVSGIVEGLAYSRFLRDRPNEDSMSCALGWLNDDVQASWRQVVALFERHPDRPPAVLLHVLIERECGE